MKKPEILAHTLSNIPTNEKTQKENRVKIARNIDLLMRSKGHNLKSFSQLFTIDVSDAAIMLSGDYNYAINDLTMIAEMFNVKLTDLLK